MTTQIHTYQCPNCRGPLQFGAGSGRLECEYCGSSFEVEKIEALYPKAEAKPKPHLSCPACGVALPRNIYAREVTCPGCGAEFETEALEEYAAQKADRSQGDMTWDTRAGLQWQEGEAEGLRVYSCQTCSGEIVVDETTGATQCPFCGNPVVLTGHFEGQLKPDLVIPFKVDKKAAIAALENHYKGKRLLPKVFKDQNHIKEVKGLYVPMWLFDADADAWVEYKASSTRTWSDSKYDYTETRHYAVIRAGAVGFNNVPVDGSTKMDDELMESIEPYDIREAVPFQTAYLPGYLADQYDVDAETSVGRANERIRHSTEDAFRSTVMGYDTVTATDSNIRLENGRARYALYPVWILNTQWNGRKFTFAVNGQTGKTCGDLPMDKAAFWRWLLGVTGGVAAAVFAVCWCLWL